MTADRLRRLIVRASVLAMPLALAACLDPFGLPDRHDSSELNSLAFRGRGGSLSAQLELGKRYEEGRGVPVNLDIARRLYRSAAAGEVYTSTMIMPAADGGAPETWESRGDPVPGTGLPEARERLTRIEARLAGRAGGVPTNGGAPSTDYRALRIGAWTLRSDPRARVPESNLRTSVIELRASTADGSAHWLVLDNGRSMTTSLVLPYCSSSRGVEGYEPRDGLVARLAALSESAVTYCPYGDHRATVEGWVRDLPAALDAMRGRAFELHGERPERCVEAPRDPLRPPPTHPLCGWGPQEIASAP